MFLRSLRMPSIFTSEWSHSRPHLALVADDDADLLARLMFRLLKVAPQRLVGVVCHGGGAQVDRVICRQLSGEEQTSPTAVGTYLAKRPNKKYFHCKDIASQQSSAKKDGDAKL